MYEVTVNMENLPKGADVEVDGLGVFQNGSSFEVSDEEAEAFRDRHQTIVYTTDESGNMKQDVTRGPTVLQAFQKVKGFSVSVVKGQQLALDDPDEEEEEEDDDA